MIGFSPQGRVKRTVNPSSFSPFTTNFPLTETPITGYKLGLTDGLDWQNVNSVPGKAYGVGPTSGTADCVAVKTGFTSNKHSSQITVYHDPTYTAPVTVPFSHEVEALTGATITANSIFLYEFDIDAGGTGVFVRWNGAIGNFTVHGTGNWTDVATPTDVISGITNGDVVKVEYDATGSSPVLKAYLNGVLKITLSDTSVDKIMSGQPGFGFFARPDAQLDMQKYCISSWTAANL